MMTRYVKILILSLTAFGVFSLPVAHSETRRVSLKEILDLVDQRSAVRDHGEALKRAAQAKLNEAHSLRWLPKIDLQLFGGVVPDATVDPNNILNFDSSDFEGDFSISDLGFFFRLQLEALQPIYTFGKISNAISAAERGQAIAVTEQQKLLVELRFLTKKSYYTLQLARDSQIALVDVENRLQTVLKKVDDLLATDAENVSETDQLKIRVFAADVRNRKIDASRAERLSRLALEDLTGLQGDWEMAELSLSADSILGLNEEKLIETALQGLPELKQLEALIDVKESERAAIRADFFPTIFVGGQLNYGVAPGRTDIQNPFLKDDFNFFNLGVGIGLKQDLGVHRTWTKIDGLQAEIDRLRSKREQMVVRTKLELRESLAEAFSAEESFKVNEEGFRAARSWLTATGLSFNLGTAETKEVLESYAAYFKARIDLIRSLYNLNIALSEVSKSSGVEVLAHLK